MYAQTNIQLFNPLCRAGYSTGELSCIVNAYQLAMRLFTGRVQVCGKTFIAHVVGTASILGSLHLPAEIVAAGLIHNVYNNGDFGSGRTDVSAAKRKKISRAVDMGVEQYVYRFSSLGWNSQTIPIIRDGLDALDATDRNVVLINLANDLEYLLDLGILYRGNNEGILRHINRDGQIMVEVADKLGFPTLAAELSRMLAETAMAEIPMELRSPRSWNHSVVFVPESCRKLLSVALNQQLHRGLHFLRSHHLRRRLAGRIHRVRLSLGVGQKARS